MEKIFKVTDLANKNINNKERFEEVKQLLNVRDEIYEVIGVDSENSFYCLRTGTGIGLTSYIDGSLEVWMYGKPPGDTIDMAAEVMRDVLHDNNFGLELKMEDRVEHG
jgi:hypothetical protein